MLYYLSIVGGVIIGLLLSSFFESRRPRCLDCERVERERDA